MSIPSVCTASTAPKRTSRARALTDVQYPCQANEGDLLPLLRHAGSSSAVVTASKLITLDLITSHVEASNATMRYSPDPGRATTDALSSKYVLWLDFQPIMVRRRRSYASRGTVTSEKT
jgi:hypothetical protein